LRTPYLVQRGKQYYFQLRLPADVQKHFQCTQLKKSLKTINKRHAVTKIKVLSIGIERAFFMIRSGLLTPQMITEIVTDVKEGLLEMHRRHFREAGVNKAQQFGEIADKFQNRYSIETMLK